MLTEEELSLIDEWRHAHRIATRSDAIRRLCQMAITLDEDLEISLDRSEGLLESFEETLKIMEEDMARERDILARDDLTKAERDEHDLLLFNLRAGYFNTAQLCDEYLWVYYHWLDVNNVTQLIAQAHNRREAVRAMIDERDRLTAVRNDLLGRAEKFLEEPVDPSMPVETMLPLGKGRRPGRVKMRRTRGEPDVSSEA